MSNKIRYKLLDKNLQSYNNYQWTLNEWRHTSGEDFDLCTSAWLHCYNHPLLAVLLNEFHAGFIDPLLFRCKVKGRHLEDNGAKEGWNNMKIVNQISIPVITNIQKIAFGILCTKEACKDKKWNVWNVWANNWLSGKDRSRSAACNAYYQVHNSMFHDDGAYAACYITNAIDTLTNTNFKSMFNPFHGKIYCYHAIMSAAQKNSTNLLKLAKQAMKYN